MGLTRTETGDARRRTKVHIVFLCELYEAQASQGRYFVHELTSEASSRMKCVVKIMAMPGTKAAIADLCIFGLAACDDGGTGFVNANVRTITNARQVGVRLPSKCSGMLGSTLTTQPREGNKRGPGFARWLNQWRNN